MRMPFFRLLDFAPYLNAYFRACFREEGVSVAMRFIALLFLIVISGKACAEESAKTKLDSCIAYYQDGEYQKAADSLKALLPLIANRSEEAEAYKYLAFSYVMLDMIEKAKDFFRVALEKFPQISVDTLEVPPNIAIVFKQAQLEAKLAKGEILDKDVQRRNEKRVIAATALTVTGTITSGIGGYFTYRGYRSNRSYHEVTRDDPDRDSLLNYWSEKKEREYLIGGLSAAAGIVQLGIATWLYFGKPTQKKISAYWKPGECGLAWRF
jgi:tetratricopeptide (TPR) repeat protein